MKHPGKLEMTYTAHHAARGRNGFSYRVAERRPQFAAWVGTGGHVLPIVPIWVLQPLVRHLPTVFANGLFRASKQ